MSKYLATINTPGYLPWDDDPPTFDTAAEAWDYLAGERREQEDGQADGASGYSGTKNILEALGRGDMWADYIDELDGTGSVHGETPGYDGDHDLGLAYCVTLTEEEES